MSCVSDSRELLHASLYPGVERLSGQGDFACISLTAVVSQIQAGTIKAMAIASSQSLGRSQGPANTKEGGLPEFQVSAWNAIFAPKNLPPDLQAKLNDAVVKALDDEATTKRLLQIGSLNSRQEGAHTTGTTKVGGGRSGPLGIGPQGGGSNR
jgi:tripartite-type tricarboxylate transporter receptor subunit TctC